MKTPIMMKTAVYSVIMQKKRFLRKPKKAILFNDDRASLNQGVLSYKARGYKMRPNKKTGYYFTNHTKYDANKLQKFLTSRGSTESRELGKG